MFLTAAKSNGREGRVICVRTKDGGRSWQQVGLVGPEPEGNDFAIMPSSLRLSPTSILTLVRHRRWIESYRTDDNGVNWTHVVRAVPDTGRGNPPSLVRLRDGRFVVTFGYRAEPFGIRAQDQHGPGQELERRHHSALRRNGLGSGLHAQRSAAGREGRHRLLLQRRDVDGALHRGNDLDALIICALLLAGWNSPWLASAGRSVAAAVSPSDITRATIVVRAGDLPAAEKAAGQVSP